MNDKRYARQLLMFGEAGQMKIEAQPVAIVGLGGLGSHVAQSLAYLGVKHFLLIDHDRIDETNLNRVAGATFKDIGRLKVEVARDLIMSINPKARVVVIEQNLRTRSALNSLVTQPIIFGCVDNDGARLIMTELTAAYGLTLIDLATEIFPETKDRPFNFGGRVVIARPGNFCLMCAQEIDLELAKQDLESPEIRAARKNHGYGLGNNLPSPSVYPLNGVIANLSVTEFLKMVTNVGEPVRKLTYLGLRGAVRDSTDVRLDSCYTCCELFGKRDKANIWRYLLPEV